MAAPVFTVDPQASLTKKSQVHLLPCRIHHDGNVDPIGTYWNPSEGPDGKKIAYLRGRKLYGKATKLPEGYYGSVVEKSEAKKPKTDEGAMEDVVAEEDFEDALDVGAMQGRAAFDELTIWGHESTTDAHEDPYVRSMEEWVSFAEQIHSYPAVDVSSKKPELCRA
ncbi:ribonuclease H1 small subunit [Durotheca rogersii]|uniref:ribonuclease H1 small subunit n=1 Tax=Durotheca rogersii TaxID=419775 RepID=UPI0022202709|nr:ribonuclease H1 small subunit [Durotheca rogersii]KAI5861601.1 ribonuclease H1 small subunit [Durotheca rogersii]